MPAPKREPEWVAAFLAALGACGNVTRSAKLAGVDVTGVYNRRLRYPEFKAACERVKAEREMRAAGSLDGLGTSGEGQAPSPGSPLASPSALGRNVALTFLDHAGHDQPDAPSRGEELVAGVGPTGVRLGRVAASRWSAGAEERFLEELTASANVARAAAAAGFSATAIYKRKLRDKHFAAGWEAAIAVGRARLEAHLLVAAERSFDPETLPVAEGAPMVSVGEAISILKHKPTGTGSGPPGRRADGYMDWVTDDDVDAMTEADEARERIMARLERLAKRVDRDKIELGWTKHGEDWIPPGWSKSEP